MTKKLLILMVFAVLAYLTFTPFLYIHLYWEWLIITIISSISAVILVGPQFKEFPLSAAIVLSFFIYIVFIIYDILIDYVIFANKEGPQDGKMPSFRYVLSESFDDYGLLNLITPILCGIIILFIKNRQSNM